MAEESIPRKIPSAAERRRNLLKRMPADFCRVGDLMEFEVPAGITDPVYYLQLRETSLRADLALLHSRGLVEREEIGTGGARRVFWRRPPEVSR